MFLPARLLRYSVYSVVGALSIFLLLLTANRKRLIHMDDILPSKLMPAYFQPPSDSYLVDIAIGGCNLFNKKSSTCGVPKASSGLYGDAGENGGWTRMEKDLLLGSHWTAKSFLSIKRITSDFYERSKGEVILDVTVGNSKLDCAIRGNKKCIPKAILTELNMQHTFDGDDLAALKDLNKHEPLKLDSDYFDKKKTKGDAKEAQVLQAEEAKTEKEALREMSQAENTEEQAASKASRKGGQNEDTESNQTLKAENTKDSKTEAAQSSSEVQPSLKRRRVEKSHTDLKDYMRIPKEKEIQESGWVKKEGNIWVKYGKATDNAVSAIDILYGSDAVDPRPNWKILEHPLDLGMGVKSHPRLTIRKGPKIDYKSTKYNPSLKFDSEGNFKVLQVADLHFSTGPGQCRDPVPESSAKGCLADPRTLKFIESVLDLEQPDFVVMTGDQIFGETAPDPETALLKAVAPFILRQIPYAITLGNHDDESVLNREQIMKLASSLPYSVAVVGPENVDGFGNYAVTVGRLGSTQPSAVFYFLDSHSRSKNPKIQGYDWFKESQVDWLGLQSQAFLEQAPKMGFFRMAFFHIPIPEYRKANVPMVGQSPEGITAAKMHTGMREALGKAGVQAVSCGHDHANDFCKLDASDNSESGSMWLCYGGGAGEGGYGGYGGYIRRVRIFSFIGKTNEIITWKRAENNPQLAFDSQTIVKDGSVELIADLHEAVEKES